MGRSELAADVKLTMLNYIKGKISIKNKNNNQLISIKVAIPDLNKENVSLNFISVDPDDFQWNMKNMKAKLFAASIITR